MKAEGDMGTRSDGQAGIIPVPWPIPSVGIPQCPMRGVAVRWSFLHPLGTVCGSVGMTPAACRAADPLDLPFPPPRRTKDGASLPGLQLPRDQSVGMVRRVLLSCQVSCVHAWT